MIPSTLRGGVEEYALRIATAIAGKGWDVHVAFPNRKETATLADDFEANGIKYHPLEIPEKQYRKLLRLRKDLPHLIRTSILLHKIKPERVQIIPAYTSQCFGSILACGLSRTPTLVRFGLIRNKHRFSKNQIKAYAWARARNQQWMTVSDNNRDLACESFQIPRNQIICIHNGAKSSADTATSSAEENHSLRQKVRDELGLDKSATIALTVGRLNQQKGYSDLIPAIPHILKEFPNVRFIWAGEGEQQDELVATLQEYEIEDKVLLVGYRSDIPRLLESADLFVFPTHYEGSPSAIMEAMAHDLAIVSSDSSGIPEVITDRKHGLLFKTGDSCGLLESVRWALRHPKEMQQMARSAKQRVLKSFSVEKMVCETIDALEHLPQN